MKPVFNEFKIGKIEATNIYWYTEAIQSMLYQFKGCNDFELKEVFLDYYFLYFKEKYSGYTIIPAPSSKEANERRGFNQVTEMFKKMKLPLIDCCYKTKDYEQHNLASEERKQTGKLIEIKDVDLSKTKVLLVDDVYTTGSTIKKMIELVQKRGAKKIRVLVMAKTIDLDLRQ